jgi:hypothetical protein
MRAFVLQKENDRSFSITPVAIQVSAVTLGLAAGVGVLAAANLRLMARLVLLALLPLLVPALA